MACKRAGVSGGGDRGGAMEKERKGPNSQGREEAGRKVSKKRRRSYCGYRLRPTPSSHCGWGELMQHEGISDE